MNAQIGILDGIQCSDAKCKAMITFAVLTHFDETFMCDAADIIDRITLRWGAKVKFHALKLGYDVKQVNIS